MKESQGAWVWFAQLNSAQLTPFWSFTAKARKELKGEAQKAANAAP